MENHLESIYNVLKAIWILCIAVFFTTSIKQLPNLSLTSVEPINWVFIIVSSLLAFIRFIGCFQPVPHLVDWLRVSKDVPPLKYNFFTQMIVVKIKMWVYGISGLIFYLFIMLYVVSPQSYFIMFLVLGFILRSLYYILNSLVPIQPAQDVTLIFPELAEID
jgi:hypothetical protein